MKIPSVPPCWVIGQHCCLLDKYGKGQVLSHTFIYCLLMVLLFLFFELATFLLCTTVWYFSLNDNKGILHLESSQPFWCIELGNTKHFKVYPSHTTSDDFCSVFGVHLSVRLPCWFQWENKLSMFFIFLPMYQKKKQKRRRKKQRPKPQSPCCAGLIVFSSPAASPPTALNLAHLIARFSPVWSESANGALSLWLVGCHGDHFLDSVVGWEWTAAWVVGAVACAHDAHGRFCKCVCACVSESQW